MNEKLATVTELQEQIEDLENDIYNLRFERTEIESKLDYAEEQKASLEQKLADIQATMMPQDFMGDLEYWRQFFFKYLDDFNMLRQEQLNGQWSHNGKWYICNGYILIERNEAFPDISACIGTDFYHVLDGFEQAINVDLNQVIAERQPQLVKLSDTLQVQRSFIRCAVALLGVQADYQCYDNGASGLMIATPHGRAVVLGVRNGNKYGGGK